MTGSKAEESLSHSLRWCGWRKNGPPEDVHVLIPGTCGCTLRGKKGFTGVVKYLQMGLMDLLVGP